MRSFKKLFRRAFGGRQPAGQAEGGSDASVHSTQDPLVEFIDRSWSGRGRRHFYSGGGAAGSRDASFRGGRQRPGSREGSHRGGSAGLPRCPTSDPSAEDRSHRGCRAGSYHGGMLGRRPVEASGLAAGGADASVRLVPVAGPSPEASPEPSLPVPRASSSPCLVSAASGPQHSGHSGAHLRPTKDSASSVTAQLPGSADDTASAAASAGSTHGGRAPPADGSAGGTPKGVSLLSRQLRTPPGGSLAGSVAPSRDASVRQPPVSGPQPARSGGLSAALSREASKHGGTHGLARPAAAPPSSGPAGAEAQVAAARAAAAGPARGASSADAVGSWAGRVKYGHSAGRPGLEASDSALASPPRAPPLGGKAGAPSSPRMLSTRLDPAELAAALESLSTEASGPSPSRQPGSRQQLKLVGDPEWASFVEPAAAAGGGSCSAGGADAPPRPGHQLVGSWAEAGMLAAAAESAPAFGRLASPAGAQAAAAESESTAAADGQPRSKDWDRKFIRRWRNVRRRAHLQAIGLRGLWRASSPGDRHEPPELLMDNPALERGARLAGSSGRLGRGRLHGSHASLGSSAANMQRDPSLATMLLGEVAEVC